MVRWIRIILIATLVLLQGLVGIPDYLYAGHVDLESALTYSFFHANWWHLAINAIAIWTIYDPKRGCKPCRDFSSPHFRITFVPSKDKV